MISMLRCNFFVKKGRRGGAKTQPSPLRPNLVRKSPLRLSPLRPSLFIPNPVRQSPLRKIFEDGTQSVQVR